MTRSALPPEVLEQLRTLDPAAGRAATPPEQLTQLCARIMGEQPSGETESTAAPRPSRPPHRRRRWIAAAATAAAAAGAIVTPVIDTQVPGLGPAPAYAVTPRHDGEVAVHVSRLEGADSLEQALREHGIAADITYLPYGKQCAPGRYTKRRNPGVELMIGLNEFEVTIPAGAVGKNDTLVLSAAVIPTRNGFDLTVGFGIASGPVKPCQVIDSP
jgi:hypothetical protein